MVQIHYRFQNEILKQFQEQFRNDFETVSRTIFRTISGTVSDTESVTGFRSGFKRVILMGDFFLWSWGSQCERLLDSQCDVQILNSDWISG